MHIGGMQTWPDDGHRTENGGLKWQVVRLISDQSPKRREKLPRATKGACIHKVC